MTRLLSARNLAKPQLHKFAQGVQGVNCHVNSINERRYKVGGSRAGQFADKWSSLQIEETLEDHPRSSSSGGAPDTNPAL